MKTPTPAALSKYQADYAKWLKNGGLDGAGGPWNRTEKRYMFGTKPEPAHYDITDPFALKIAAKLKAIEDEKHAKVLEAQTKTLETPKP